MTRKNSVGDNFRDGEQICSAFCNAERGEALYMNEYWEIAYVYEGEGIVCASDKQEEIRSGQFVFTAPGAAHALRPKNERKSAAVRFCRCIFTREYFDAVMKSCSEIPDIQSYALFKLMKEGRSFCFRLTDDRRSNIRNLLWLIAHEYGHSTTGTDAVIKYCVNALFICVSRLYENRVNKVVETATDHIVDDIKSYIKANFGYKITLQDLSDRVHLSREHISRYFKQKTGMNISQFILETRIERAADKIRTTTIPIGDIAEYCGYSSVSNFQKAFRRITGQSPACYRETHKVITEQN